jgi:hypothetical protein
MSINALIVIGAVVAVAIIAVIYFVEPDRDDSEDEWWL